MNHKERVLKTLSSEKPDRVPFFYWNTPGFEEKIIKHLNLNTKDELLEYLDVDFRWVEPKYVGKPLIASNGKTKTDIWGVGYTQISKNGFTYWQADKFPFEGITDIEAVKEYQWPTVDMFDFEDLDQQLEKYKDYAVMSAPGYSSPGLFRIAKRLIGFEHFEEVMMNHSKFFKAICLKITDFYKEFLDCFFDVAGERLDFIRIADNFGTESGAQIGNYHWEEFIEPAFKVFTERAIKSGAHFYMHSSGGVRKLLPQFISAGAEVLDPIQTTASGMSPEGLKKDFGSIITFCGALDEEQLFGSSSLSEVKKGVNEILDIMGPGGRFILGPSQKIRPETPVENVIEMYKAAKEWQYPDNE